MNNPLVSIIVPVYNVQNSVARCLESICAQTWKNIEVILVNDGSRDESFILKITECILTNEDTSPLGQSYL